MPSRLRLIILRQLPVLPQLQLQLDRICSRNRSQQFRSRVSIRLQDMSREQQLKELSEKGRKEKTYGAPQPVLQGFFGSPELWVTDGMGLQSGQSHGGG